MPEIQAYRKAHIINAGQVLALGLSLFALLSACQTNNGGGGEPPVSPYEWTWVAGSDTVNQKGTYGTLRVAASTNVPGAREEAVSWRDTNDGLWLFGGNAYDSAGLMGSLNDLWNFDPATLEWTWVSGSSIRDQAGSFGTMGEADPSNVPGARRGAVSCIDSAGNLWLFGGFGYYADGEFANLNDLWKFDPTTLEWTWVSGSDTGGEAGVYGTLGTPDPDNVPGARRGAVSWIDAEDNIWLFGGYGHDAAGDKGWLNDLWKFDPTTLEWTWVSGSDTGGQKGTYGTKGTSDPGNVPGGRHLASSWMGSNGFLWLFGGNGLDADGTRANLNDLWLFDPATLEWTWKSGSKSGDATGVYGTLASGLTTNCPGGRNTAVTWTDSSGILKLFGGYGVDSAPATGWLNDLWEFDPTTLKWMWASGSTTAGKAGTFGTKGTAAAANVPGARYSAVSWIDSDGVLWLFGGYGSDSAGTGGWLNDLWRADE